MLSDMFSEQQYEGMTEREQVPNQTEDVSQSCKSEVNKMWESGERIRGSDERLQHDWENASGSSRDVLAPQVETHSDGIVTRTPDQNQFTVDVNGDSKYREQNVATSAQLQSQPVFFFSKKNKEFNYIFLYIFKCGVVLYKTNGVKLDGHLTVPMNHLTLPSNQNCNRIHC